MCVDYTINESGHANGIGYNRSNYRLSDTLSRSVDYVYRRSSSRSDFIYLDITRRLDRHFDDHKYHNYTKCHNR